MVVFDPVLDVQRTVRVSWIVRFNRHDSLRVDLSRSRSTAAKNDLKPHITSYWEIPLEQDADFVYYMEDVLNLYHEPYDENRPVICFDDSSKALCGHDREPLPAQPEAVARIYHRYERNGKQRLHISAEPLTGWVNIEIIEKRLTREWADRMVELADVHYPDADRIRVVMDQLNTHKPADSTSLFRQIKLRRILIGSGSTTRPSVDAG